MSRSEKDPRLRKLDTLQVPVSAEERQLIMAAALAAEGEFAGWARAVLIRAAEACRSATATLGDGENAAPKKHRNGETTRSIVEAEEELPPAALGRIWQHLGPFPKLGAMADVDRGVEFVKKAVHEGAETDVPTSFVSHKPVPGFKEGLPPSALPFCAFVSPPTTFLSVRPEDHANEAWKLPWEDPKVLVSIALDTKDHWRLAACADFRGLVAHHDFLVVWPRDEKQTLILEAVLNGPVANAYLATHDLNGDLRETLGQVPIPEITSDHALQVTALVSEYKLSGSAGQGLTPRGQRNHGDLLRAIDAAVLRAYDLPPRLERELLDFFNGARRQVPFAFGDYFPPTFSPAIPLWMFISAQHDKSNVRCFLQRMPLITDPALIASLQDME